MVQEIFSEKNFPPASGQKKEPKKETMLDKIFDHVVGVIDEELKVIEGIFVGKNNVQRRTIENKVKSNPLSGKAKELLSRMKRTEKEKKEEKKREIMQKLNKIGYDEKLKEQIDEAIERKEEELKKSKDDFEIKKEDHDAHEKQLARAEKELQQAKNYVRDARGLQIKALASSNPDIVKKADEIFEQAELEMNEKQISLSELQKDFELIKSAFEDAKRDIRRLEKGKREPYVGEVSHSGIIDSLGIEELKKLSKQIVTAQAKEYLFNTLQNKRGVRSGHVKRNALGQIVSFDSDGEGNISDTEVEMGLNLLKESEKIKHTNILRVENIVQVAYN